MSGHGHVMPNPDGSKARCGGPGICPECSKEAAMYRPTPAVVVMTGRQRESLERRARSMSWKLGDLARELEAAGVADPGLVRAMRSCGERLYAMVDTGPLKVGSLKRERGDAPVPVGGQGATR